MDHMKFISFMEEKFAGVTPNMTNSTDEKTSI